MEGICLVDRDALLIFNTTICAQCVRGTMSLIRIDFHLPQGGIHI